MRFERRATGDKIKKSRCLTYKKKGIKNCYYDGVGVTPVLDNHVPHIYLSDGLKKTPPSGAGSIIRTWCFFLILEGEN